MGALIYTTSVLGYSLRDAFYFFHQPIVYRYKALYNANVEGKDLKTIKQLVLFMS